MKFQADIRISINSGAALVLFVLAFFGLLGLVALSPAVAGVYAVALGGLTLAFGGYLKKRDSNNKLDLEAAKAGLTADPGRGLANA